MQIYGKFQEFSRKNKLVLLGLVSYFMTPVVLPTIFPPKTQGRAMDARMRGSVLFFHWCGIQTSEAHEEKDGHHNLWSKVVEH